MKRDSMSERRGGNCAVKWNRLNATRARSLSTPGMCAYRYRRPILSPDLADARVRRQTQSTERILPIKQVIRLVMVAYINAGQIRAHNAGNQNYVATAVQLTTSTHCVS